MTTPGTAIHPRSARRHRSWGAVVLAAAILLVGAGAGAYLWLANAPLASGVTLRCDDIDPFRCRQSATTAVEWFDGMRSSFRTTAVIVSAEVWADDPVQTICHGDCEPGELDRVQRMDVVKVSYRAGGQDWLSLVWCRDGSHYIFGSPFPVFGRLNRPPSAC